MFVHASPGLSGVNHAVEIDGALHVSPAIMSLLETDFEETMRSLTILAVRTKTEKAVWKHKIKA